MKKICMPCTLEQYESVKNLIGGLKNPNPKRDFKIYNFIFTIVHDVVYKACLVFRDVEMPNTEYFDKFDRKILLSACGITE